MNSFTALTTTKLGYRGEEFISEFAASKKSKAYIPAVSQSYPIDGLAITEKGVLYGIEVKTKPRLMYYEKTGFDAADWMTYTNLPFPVYVLFVDYITKSIYGSWISNLKQFSEPKGNLVLFPLSAMTHYRYLNENEVEYIKELNGSKYYK